MAKKPDLVYSNYKPDRLRKANNALVNQQIMTERMYQRHLTELCVNRFKWENMPEEIDLEALRWLELHLFYNGCVVFFQHPDNDHYMVAHAAGTGQVNWYDNPTEWTVMGAQLKSMTFPDDECVPIYGNALRTPDTDIVNLYSYKLANLDRTIEITTKNLRVSKMVTVEESQRLTWVNLFRQVEEGAPFIFGVNSSIDLGAVQALDTGAMPEALPKLLEAKAKLWNECMGLLGLNNANQDKKERLVSDEVSANDEQVQASRNIHLKARKMAAKKINKMFNLNVEVKFDDMLDTAIPSDADSGLHLVGNESSNDSADSKGVA